MSRIHVLPVTVQNKIAAGEVIERPASVVKELAENAMDAGALQINVDLEDGGHRLVRVADDGWGMDEADLVASMQRHATSKIKDVDDIFRIATFGFRGEALPSIGAVSRMAVATCLPGADAGHELLVEGGRIVRVSPSAPRRGTRVEVRDIFFNTPARRKFLRSPSSENTRAAELLTRLALGNPAIGFNLRCGERITLAVHPAADQRERIRQLFGDELAGRLVPFANDVADGLRIDGFFARPPTSRRNSKDIAVLVNRRWIRHFGLARAAADAFQGILPPREYPFAIINLHVDPARVDVNAHPTKEEVRFEQDGLIIAGVKRAIREALAGVATLPTAVTLSGAAGAAAPPETRKNSNTFEGQPVAGGQKSFELPTSLARGRGDFSGIDLAAARERMRAATGERPDSAAADAAVAAAAGSVYSAPAETARPATPSGDADDFSRPESAPAAPVSSDGMRVGPAGSHRILGQAGGKYILVDGPDGLLLVDPHALHERWNFDRLVEERRRGGSSRRLLLPVDIKLSPAETAAAGEAAESLGEFGFEILLDKPGRMRVTAAPAFLPPARLENMLRQVLADVGEAGDTVGAMQEKLLASLACRASVLLGRSLPEEEMLTLLDRFFNLGQMPTCPHGRPTAIRIGWEELARRFGR